MVLTQECPTCQKAMVPIVYAHRTPDLQKMENEGLIKIAGCQVYLGYTNGPTLFCNSCKDAVWADKEDVA
jgi:hypothetical protein